MLANLIFPKENKLADIELDIIISESVTTKSTVTENPVEYGADVADHIVTNAMTFTMSGIVSDTPVKLLGGLLSGNVGGIIGDFLGMEKPSIKAWNKLLELQVSRKPFDLVTNLKTYSNVAITSLVTTQDKDTSKMLNFSATLQEIIMVGTNEITDEQFNEADTSDSMAKTKDEGVKE